MIHSLTLRGESHFNLLQVPTANYSLLPANLTMFVDPLVPGSPFAATWGYLGFLLLLPGIAGCAYLIR